MLLVLSFEITFASFPPDSDELRALELTLGISDTQNDFPARGHTDDAVDYFTFHNSSGVLLRQFLGQIDK